VLERQGAALRGSGAACLQCSPLLRQLPRTNAIKEGKLALRWTRLSCRAFRDNEVRLQLFALAYNLASFLRSLVLPNQIAQWSLTT
jgi:hypothetical protein